jgi:hypothetical protein
MATGRKKGGQRRQVMMETERKRWKDEEGGR